MPIAEIDTPGMLANVDPAIDESRCAEATEITTAVPPPAPAISPGEQSTSLDDGAGSLAKGLITAAVMAVPLWAGIGLLLYLIL